MKVIEHSRLTKINKARSLARFNPPSEGGFKLPSFVRRVFHLKR